MTKEIDDGVATLVSLLGLYDGVEVLSTRIADGMAFLELEISSVDSIVRLAYWSTAANVHCSMYAKSLPEQSGDIASSLKKLAWQFKLSGDRHSPDQTSQVIGFCAFLVWDLSARGEIDPDEELRIRHRWNIGPRGDT